MTMKTFVSKKFLMCYADTDAGGVVYHSRYVDLAERARMEMLHELGVCCREMAAAEKPVGFMVHHMEIDFKRPAYLEDELVVETSVLKVGGATFDLAQTVKRGDEVLVELKVCVLTAAGIGKPTRIPAEIRTKLTGIL